MNIRHLVGAAAAIAGVALFGAGPAHAAVLSGTHSAAMNAVVASPAPSATINWYDRNGNWHPDNDRSVDRDDRRFYHRDGVTRVYTYPAPPVVARPLYAHRWYHNHRWYDHRRLQGGIWIYF